MRILVVTSEVTFVPMNYNQFLDGLFRDLKNEDDLIIELVILKNNSIKLLFKGFFLILSGAHYIGFHLIKNSILALFKDRRRIAINYNIPVHFFKNPNSSEFIRFVKNHQTDLIINARTRFIYKKEILKQPRLGAINIHHGLLPDFRGTMCDLWALHEDRPTGFTFHVMEKKIDAGSIIRRVQTSTPISLIHRSNFADLIFQSSKIEGIEMAGVIKIINKNQSIPIEMDNITTQPTYTKNPDFFSIRKMLQKGLKL